ncbi:MAG: LamG-like jellyroll fold domain-containing protein, partial [Planctomycetota bacterium]
DPLMHRTFGGCIRGDGLASAGDRQLKSAAPAKRFVVSVHPLTAQTDTPEAWIELLGKRVASADGTDIESARAGHRRWWEAFWSRSWIFVKTRPVASSGPGASSNKLPLRIGADSEGKNRFVGRIARARVFGKALAADEIRALAASGVDAPVGKAASLVAGWRFDALAGGAFADGTGGARRARIVGEAKLVDDPRGRCVELDGRGYLEVAHDEGLDLAGGFTLEAWIAPARLPAAGSRIIDKTRAGTSNGYLLDTHPGNSLRSIVRAGTLGHAAKLVPGTWVHVASAFDPGSGRHQVFVDGRPVASAGGAGEGARAADASPVMSPVSRGYTLQRWINACGGRGRYPIKFNGTIFTVDARESRERYDADYRRWGGNFWFQNTRLPYWTMLASGDFDLMDPLWKMYLDALPMARERTRLYYGHDGAFFPETMYFWGTYGNVDFGWGHKGPDSRNDYIRYYWSSGIELVTMMLDRYAFTQDRDFARATLVPFATEIVTFYDRHWKRGADGKIRFEPSHSLETWWVCVNSAPEVGGLKYVIGRLLELPDGLASEEQRAAWRKTLADLPPVPTREERGKRFVLAGESFSSRHNSENPELYVVFPYRLFGVGKPDLETGLETWRRRRVKGTGGWRQDSIQAAYLGLTREAAGYVAKSFSTKHGGSRFPAFWGPNFDWIPDQDHGGVAMTAL